MLIIGCDYHPGMQQIAWFDEQSGEYGEQGLEHSTGEAERFYRELRGRGVQVRVGIEASGHTRWFERLLAELEMELLGDGNLNYGRENIVESYYTAHIWRGIYVAPGVQHINDPGYNRDRRPVVVPSFRLHVEF